jgi:sigma-B regulation protein RsbU (phosphoserine phosphatase)
VEEHAYEEYSLEGWPSGAIIIIGTDGVHETRNANGEMFGMNRLRSIISASAAESAKHIQDSVIQTLRSFQGNAPQEDDITLVVLKL